MKINHTETHASYVPMITFMAFFFSKNTNVKTYFQRPISEAGNLPVPGISTIRLTSPILLLIYFPLL